MKALMLLLTFISACGQPEDVVEQDRDPEVVEAIREYNLRILQGTWISSDPVNGDLYLRVTGNSYQISLVRAGITQGYDFGGLYHQNPDRIFFVSRNDTCASTTPVTGFSLYPSTRDAISLAFDRSPPTPFLRVEDAELQATGFCMWSLR